MKLMYILFFGWENHGNFQKILIIIFTAFQMYIQGI